MCLFGDCGLLFVVVWCSLFVCCVFVVCCLLFVICGMLRVAGCSFFVLYLLSVSGCWLLVGGYWLLVIGNVLL